MKRGTAIVLAVLGAAIGLFSGGAIGWRDLGGAVLSAALVSWLSVKYGRDPGIPAGTYADTMPGWWRQMSRAVDVGTEISFATELVMMVRSPDPVFWVWAFVGTWAVLLAHRKREREAAWTRG